MKKIIPCLLALILILSPAFAQSQTSYLKSLVLPGWGELSEGGDRFYVPMLAEAALWLGFAGLKYSHSVNSENMINYADIHAGLSDNPGESAFWADMSNYISYAEHVESLEENRETEDMWDSAYSWEWDSETSQLTFSDLHRRTQQTNVGTQFIIAGVVVNRIVSLINVRVLSGSSSKLNGHVSQTPGGAQLNLGVSF